MKAPKDGSPGTGLPAAPPRARAHAKSPGRRHGAARTTLLHACAPSASRARPCRRPCTWQLLAKAARAAPVCTRASIESGAEFPGEDALAAPDSWDATSTLPLSSLAGRRREGSEESGRLAQLGEVLQVYGPRLPGWTWVCEAERLRKHAVRTWSFFLGKVVASNSAWLKHPWPLAASAEQSRRASL